jgi:ribosomal protein S1
VESKEAKGWMVDLGLKDGARGFIRLGDFELKLGDLAQVVVKSASTKVVKCELLSDASQTVSTDETEVTIHTLKPGYLVNAKVNKLMENGLELRFLKGMTGTVFADHLDRPSISSYKVSDKVIARVTHVDVSSKSVTLSALPHIVGLTPSHFSELKVG